MSPLNSSASTIQRRSGIERRTGEILTERLTSVYTQTDRLFAFLFGLQWAAAIIAAMLFSPRTWAGSESNWHVHVWAAALLGGLLTLGPVAMAYFAPGRLATRMVISLAQAGYSALLIHLSGGRIETHFHIFGSLAFLAFYRDWRVLVPATLVVAVDHLVRGAFWPQSVFGALDPSTLRALEHVAWVAFEDIFLVWSCVSSKRALHEAARTQAELECAKQSTEQTVQERTAELQIRTTELESSIDESRRMTARLAQAQKLESIGQLAAGVAHEINTPMQFISDNSLYLKECMERLLRITSSYAATLDLNGPRMSWEERHARVMRVLEECGHDELQREVPAAIAENLEGIERVVTMVRAMKEFSHPGNAARVVTDLNQAIRSTATITRNRWKYAADLKLDLDPDLPAIKVLPAELNQVFLNLIVNAADAIREKLGDDAQEPGQIIVRTYVKSDYVVIDVEDSGIGISEEVKPRLFDQFFTTKDVGMGTGQGLPISHDIVVNKHGGFIDVESVEGHGAKFSVKLPIHVQWTGDMFLPPEPLACEPTSC